MSEMEQMREEIQELQACCRMLHDRASRAEDAVFALAQELSRLAAERQEMVNELDSLIQAATVSKASA